MTAGINGENVRRRLTSVEKAAVLAEAFGPGGSVAAAAERFGASTAAIYLWRRQAGESRAHQHIRHRRVAPAAAAPQAYAAVRIAAPSESAALSPDPIGCLGRVEIVLGNGRVLKADASVDPVRLAAIVAALDDDARLRQNGRAP